MNHVVWWLIYSRGQITYGTMVRPSNHVLKFEPIRWSKMYRWLLLERRVSSNKTSCCASFPSEIKKCLKKKLKKIIRKKLFWHRFKTKLLLFHRKVKSSLSCKLSLKIESYPRTVAPKQAAVLHPRVKFWLSLNWQLKTASQVKIESHLRLKTLKTPLQKLPPGIVTVVNVAKIKSSAKKSGIKYHKSPPKNFWKFSEMNPTKKLMNNQKYS